MTRTRRVVIAFGFGALLVLAGFTLGVNPDGAERWWRLLPPPRSDYDAVAAARWFDAASRYFLAAGLATQGLALAAWIVAPRDDR